MHKVISKLGIYKWFNDLNISHKMTLVYFFGMTMLLLTLTLFLVTIANRSSQEALKQDSWRAIEYGNTLIEKEQEYLIGIAEYFCISSDVQSMLRNSNLGKEVTSASELTAALRTRSYILSTVLYNGSGMPIMYMSIDYSHSPVPQSYEEGSTFFDLMSGERNYEWSFIARNDTTFMEQDNSPKLCLWHVVKDTRTMLPIGVIAVSVDTRKLLGSNTRPERFYDSLIILDSKGRDVFCSTENPVQLSADARKQLSELVRSKSGNKFGSYIQLLDSKKYHVFFGQVASTDLCTYMLVPYQFLIWDNSQIAVYAILGILVCIAMMIPMLLLCSRWITKPIKKLTSSLESFMYGDDSIRTSITGKDEIGRMGQIFNKMVQNQQELLEKSYKSKIREQAAELDMQQAQINPHFLYNMLHSIQWIALRKKDMEIANIAYAMGHFFRVSLSRGANVITVAQEFDLVKYYLYLQNFRFPDLISYSIDNDEGIQNAIVPKFIIQPLLENSIIHGMKSSDTPLHIHLTCRSNPEKSRLIIIIEDDGKGIDPSILPLLPDLQEDSTAHKSGSRFALKNINTRLNLLYRGDYTFSFQNRSEGGARISIETPLLFDVPGKE